MKSILSSDNNDAKGVDKSSVFCMEDMETMKMSKVVGGVDKKKSAAKKALKSKTKDMQVHSDKIEEF